MIKLILALVATRFITAEGRRILVLGSFYSLLREQGNCRDKMTELNDALGITPDSRTLFLAADLPSILWKDKKQEELRKFTPERLKRYYHELIPVWLKYDREGTQFNFDEDLDKVLTLSKIKNA